MKHAGNLSLLILAILSPPVTAETVTNTFCTLNNGVNVVGPGTVSQSNSTACSVTLAAPLGGVGTARASISFSSPLPVTPTTSVSASLNALVAAFPAGDLGSPQSGEGDAMGTTTLSLLTSGSMRTGLIEFSQTVQFQAGPDPPRSTAAVTVGGLSSQCAGPSTFFLTCTGNMGAANRPPQRLPFTLGQPFTFSENLLLLASSSNPAGVVESGTGSVSFQFRLLEADGETPVPVETVPEPSTWTLLAFSGVMLVAYSFRRAALLMVIVRLILARIHLSV